MTQYKSSAKAFLKMAEAAAKAAYEIFKKRPELFSRKANISNFDDFNDKYCIELRDFNTLGVVCAHNGTPFSN